jgi:glycine cleavage system H protein
MIDQEARYLESHEWVKKADGNIVSVGLSAFAIEQLGDIVYIELPSVGESVTKGKAFGVIESVKAASDMYAPVGGKVAAVNEEIPNNPDVLKTDAYNEGWLIKIEAEDIGDLDGLMDAAAYGEFLKSQEE